MEKPYRPEELYYVMKVGYFTEAFVLDVRSYRSPQDMPSDHPEKTYLGRQQLEDLFSWLLKSKARGKFVVSAGSFADIMRHGLWQGEPFLDTWWKYEAEKRELMKFISD